MKALRVLFFFLGFICVACGDDDSTAPVVEADFSVNVQSPSEGETITFTDLSTGNPTSWQWTFEGGVPVSSTDQNPTVTYNNEGEFRVTLTAANEDNRDMEEKNAFISVDGPVEADFNADLVQTSAGTIIFSDLSTGSPDEWSWSFEGGTPATSEQQHPEITYSEAGIYSVTLTVSDAISENTDTKTDYIKIMPNGLVAYYPFNGNTVDDSRNDFDGASGNVSSYIDDRNGIDESAVVLDGVDDYILTSFIEDEDEESSNYLGNGATFAFWIYPTADNEAVERIISNYDGDGAFGTCAERSGFVIDRMPDGGIRTFYATDGDDYAGRITGNSVLTPNSWNFVTVTWNGTLSFNGFVIYVNAVRSDVSIFAQGSISCSDGYQTSSEPLAIGAGMISTGNFSAHCESRIDEVQIYNRVLTNDEIALLYEEY